MTDGRLTRILEIAELTYTIGGHTNSYMAYITNIYDFNLILSMS